MKLTERRGKKGRCLRNTDNHSPYKFYILKKTFCVSCGTEDNFSIVSNLSVQRKMSMTKVNVFAVVIGTECFIICVGNAFTIFVFWNHRSGNLRRTCYLLLNLAVVDLLVGVVELIAFATQTISHLMETPDHSIAGNFGVEFLPLTFIVMFSTISVVSLAVISLERTFAVLRPLVHRTTSTRLYIYCVYFTWIVGCSMAAIHTLPVLGVWRPRYASLLVGSVIILCLCIICISYIVIRSHLKRSSRVFDCNQKRNMERNIKLSKTLFVVIALSFACWIPALILYSLSAFCHKCISEDVVMIATFLHMGNSVVNPIAYSCRMPIFKKTLNRLLKRRQENIELAQL